MQDMDDFSPQLKDKTVLITGATRGLGRYLAEAAARAGATVLAHGRDAGRLDALAASLTTEGGAVRPLRADLSDLDQVRDLAARVAAETGRLDVLVHNAVVGGGAEVSRREVSAQGIELRFAVNHLAPLLLTRSLAPLLTASAPARVVNVASMGQAEIDLDDVMFERDYEGVTAYCRSKLALIMSTFDLAAEFAGRGVTVNALHPAHLMDTDIVHESGFVPQVPVAHGGAPALRLMADPGLAAVSGEYFDRFDLASAHPQAYDAEARRRLAEIGAKLLG